MSTPYPGPLQGLSIITEDAVEHPLMGKPISLMYLDGTGVSPVRRILEKAPFQHGMSDRGYRNEPRRMTLALMLNGTNEAATDALRDQIATWFGPSNSPLKLKATRDDLTVRQIDCYLDGFIDFPQNIGERMGTGQKIVIPLVAPDPSWYYPTQQTGTVAITNGSGNNITLTITGLTADDWPVIDVTGPVDAGLIIEHVPGAQQIILSSAIPALSTFRFDLRPGYKTVRRTSDNANRMSYIDTTTLGAFSEMRVMGEKTTRATDAAYTTTNVFGFLSAAGTSGATTATVYWYKRYASL